MSWNVFRSSLHLAGKKKEEKEKGKETEKKTQKIEKGKVKE